MFDDENAPEEQTVDAVSNSESDNQDDNNELHDEANQSAENSGEKAGDKDDSDVESDEDKENKQKSHKQVPSSLKKRFGELTSERNQLKGRLQKAQEEIEFLRTKKTERNSSDAEEDEGNDKITLSPKELQEFAYKQAEQIAQQKIEQENQQKLIDKVWNQGQSEFQDFAESVEGLALLGENFKETLPVLLESPEAHRLIQHLAQDIEEANRIFSLPERQQVRELMRLEEMLPKLYKKEISKAPPPIQPVEGGRRVASVDLTDPDVPTDKWIEMRNKQVSARKR